MPAAAAVCLAALLVVDGRWFVIPDVYVAALAILGLAGASQTGWAMAAIGGALGGGRAELQRQLADGQRRYERALMVAGLQHDAIALRTDVNPTSTPEGTAPLTAGRSLRWTSTARSTPRLNTGAIRVGRRFELRLYRVQATILDRDGAALGFLAIDRVGWRKLDAPQPDEPSSRRPRRPPRARA